MGIIGAVLIVVVCSSLHELGHMLAALAFGLRVPRIGVGFGPMVVALRSTGLEWRLVFPFGRSFRLGASTSEKRSYEWRALPLGAFIVCPAAQRMRLQTGRRSKLREAIEHRRSATTAARVAVFASGPIANLATAAACFAGLVLADGGSMHEALIAPAIAAQSIAHQVRELTLSSAVGPVGVVAMLAKVDGAANAVMAVGVISAQFGLLNLLPLPPLDGARVLAAVYERAVNRRMRPRETVAFAIVAALVLATSAGLVILDCSRLIAARA